MKNLKNLKRKAKLFVPMLLYSLALTLIPTNIIARFDLRFLATIILQKRTVIALKNQLQTLLTRCTIAFEKQEKNNWTETSEA